MTLHNELRERITPEMRLTRRSAIAHLSTPRKRGTRANALTKNSRLTTKYKHPTDRTVGLIINHLVIISDIAEIEFRKHGHGLKWLCTTGKFSMWLLPVIQNVLDNAELTKDGVKAYVRRNRASLKTIYQDSICNYFAQQFEQNADCDDAIDVEIVEEKKIFALPYGV